MRNGRDRTFAHCLKRIGPTSRRWHTSPASAWVLTYGRDGRVIAVQTEVVEGLAAIRLRAVGEKAAWLYRIGADLDKGERKIGQPYELLPAR